MNAQFSPLATSNPSNVMETIMKPLSFAGRSARWLMAAGLAFAAINVPHAKAQEELEPRLELDDPDTLRPPPHIASLFFEKTGAQRDCDYVTYQLRFGMRGDPAVFHIPAFAASLEAVNFNLRDQLPAGLSIVDVAVTGDVTGPGGGAAPVPAVSTTAGPDDTLGLADFRLSATDLDGSGEFGQRHIDIRITAKIDQAAFPAATIVDNQAFIKASRPGVPSIEIPSHDPALPDDADFHTGDPTRIVIDVTGCDRPPPPPTGEPCFEVVVGEVDCVPGGGAFIYHMPVGPELGGKWVQVRTTTPGIIVAPAVQVVPAGGGVLNWTITGALPGDIVHLIVTGIETYAGPEEGVGLCCTQTVDIVIPVDLDCPDEKREPDLEVTKKADVERCTPEGGCDFTITVKNVGDAPYNGPIVLDEVTAPGSAPVVSGPNVPWLCPPMVSPMSCTHPATTLNPGEQVQLKLGFAPGPGWDWDYIGNCAEYDYTASGKEPFGRLDNDRACARIPICIPGRDRECTPPVKRLVDLRITKDPLSVSCTADGVCSFLIRVFNAGTDPYVGPLTVIDTYPTGAPTSSAFGPTPPWGCVEDSPDTFRCEHPGVVLLPGASIPLSVRAIVPDDYRSDFIRNCGEVRPIPDEANLDNNKACAGMRIPRDPGEPKLSIAKTCTGTIGAAAVSCRITVSNTGTAAPLGMVRVNDAATIIGAGTPVQIQTVTPDGAEWNCGPVPADSLACRIPGENLSPGASRHFDVTVNVSPNQRFENCALGSVGPAPGGDVIVPFGRACAQGGGGSTRLRVEKNGDLQCRIGQPCTFEITIANDGDADFSGPVRIGDAIEVDGFGRLEGVPITGIEPPFGCSPEPATLPLSCVTNLTLGAGESRVHQVTIVIPDDGRFANLTGPVGARNCVGVVPPDQPVAGGAPVLTHVPAPNDPGAGNNSACHSFTIQKQVKQECSAGFVLNADGRCVCPEGTTFRNGQCGPEQTSDPVKPTTQCKLLEGQIRTSDGRCVCPRGTELKNRKCVKDEPPVRQCTLLPGQIRTEDGRCICPRGTELVRGKCVKDEPPVRQCTLLPGQIRTQDGRCICPRGTELVRGKCVKDVPPVRQCTLLPGQIRTQDGRCICPRGTELVRGKCVKDQPPVRQCKLLPGQIRTNDGRCVCPRGTELVRGACRQRVTEPECPKGTHLVRGQCVKDRPTLQINPNLLNPNLLEQLAPRRRPQTNNNIKGQ
jgi:hypothetical protein